MSDVGWMFPGLSSLGGSHVTTLPLKSEFLWSSVSVYSSRIYVPCEVSAQIFLESSGRHISCAHTSPPCWHCFAFSLLLDAEVSTGSWTLCFGPSFLLRTPNPESLVSKLAAFLSVLLAVEPHRTGTKASSLLRAKTCGGGLGIRIESTVKGLAS